jgi:hypothetical protein
VFDSAYSHYATNEDYTNGIEYVKAGFPIIVLQTFLEIYGLAVKDWLWYITRNCYSKYLASKRTV